MEEMTDHADDAIVDEILVKAADCGLGETDLFQFLVWVRNEVAQGREVPDLVVLRERTPELVKIFKAQKP